MFLGYFAFKGCAVQSFPALSCFCMVVCRTWVPGQDKMLTRSPPHSPSPQEQPCPFTPEHQLSMFLYEVGGEEDWEALVF